MDKGKAISDFLERVDRFPQMVLVTDEEVKELFGEEVSTALAELERFGRQESLCAGCGGTCCRDIGCELYASWLSLCPIYHFRPLACRFHFCHRFDALHKSLVIELRDIFLGCYMAVDFRDSANLRSLDCPPLAGVCPELVAALSPWIEAVREGSLDPERALEVIRREAERYHRTASCDGARSTKLGWYDGYSPSFS